VLELLLFTGEHLDLPGKLKLASFFSAGISTSTGLGRRWNRGVECLLSRLDSSKERVLMEQQQGNRRPHQQLDSRCSQAH
jgi:hypothetical protein